MTDRDPRYAGGRIWGAIIIVGLGMIALALTATIVLTLLIGAM